MPGDSLWGAIPEGRKIQTPVSILKEQAELLSVATNRLLEGSVQVQGDVVGKVNATLGITAPALAGYRIEILMISHTVGLYPVFVQSKAFESPQARANDEAAYKAVLANILQSQIVNNIIERLLTQIKSAE